MTPSEIIEKQERNIEDLRKALQEAIATIQIFHGPGWDIYRDHAPEMKRWKVLLESK